MSLVFSIVSGCYEICAIEYSEKKLCKSGLSGTRSDLEYSSPAFLNKLRSAV